MGTNEAKRDRLDCAAGYLVEVHDALQLGPRGELSNAVEALRFAVGEMLGELRELRGATNRACAVAGVVGIARGSVRP